MLKMIRPGQWLRGRLVVARTDVFVRVDHDLWIMKLGDDGADGRSRLIDADDQDGALDIARDVKIGRDGCRRTS